MASDTDDLVQRIVLAGTVEVIAGFAAIGKAGTDAFKVISNAQNTTSFSGLLSNIGGLVEAFSLVTSGTLLWAKATSDSIFNLSTLAQQLGTSTENLSTFDAALVSMGADTDNLAVAMRRLATRVELDWESMQKKVRESAALWEEDTKRIEESMQSLEEATLKASEAELKLTEDTIKAAETRINALNAEVEAQFKARSDENSAIDAQLSYQEKLYQFQVKYGQRDRDPDYEKRLQRQKDEAALAQAQLQQDEANNKQQEDLRKQELERQKAQLEVRKAQQELDRDQQQIRAADLAAEAAQANIDQARTKAQEDYRNSVQASQAYIHQLLTTGQGDASTFNATITNVMQGLLAEIGPVQDKLEGFKGSFTDLASTAPADIEVLKRLADVFKALNDQGQTTLMESLATGVFGRGFSQSLIKELSQGADAIEKEQRRIQEIGKTIQNPFGLQLSPKDIEAAEEFRKSFGTLGAEVDLLSKKFAETFAPTFTTAIDAIRGAIERNVPAVLNFANAINETLKPALLGLIDSLSGGGIKLDLNPQQLLKEEEWKATFDRIKASVISWAQWFEDLVARQIPTAIQGLTTVFQQVTQVVNQVFGTSFTSGQIAAALLIGQLTGLNSLLVTLAGTFTALLIAATAALGPGGLVALAGAAIGAFVVWDWSSIVQKAENAWQEIERIWSTPFTQLDPFGNSEEANTAREEYAEREKALEQQDVQNLLNIAKTVEDTFAQVWSTFKTDSYAALEGVKNSLDALVASLVGLAKTVGSAIEGVLGDIEGMLDTLVSRIGTAIGNLLTTVGNSVKSVIDYLTGSGSQTAPAASTQGGPTPQSRAEGGIIRGPGTSTSDSIPVNASDGEYIVKASSAKAVGEETLDHINKTGEVPRYDDGGWATYDPSKEQHDAEVTAKIIKNYEEVNADPDSIKLEGTPLGEAHDENEAIRMGIRPPSSSASDLPGDNFTRARALEADAEHRRATGQPPRSLNADQEAPSTPLSPLGDAGGGGVGWENPTGSVYAGPPDQDFGDQSKGHVGTVPFFQASQNSLPEGLSPSDYASQGAAPSTHVSPAVEEVRKARAAEKARIVAKYGADELKTFKHARDQGDLFVEDAEKIERKYGEGQWDIDLEGNYYFIPDNNPSQRITLKFTSVQDLQGYAEGGKVKEPRVKITESYKIPLKGPPTTNIIAQGFADGGEVSSDADQADDRTKELFSPRNKEAVSPYSPPIGQQLAGLFQKGVELLRGHPDPSGDRAAYETAQTAEGLIPYVGAAVGAQEGIQQTQEGHPFAGTIEAATSLFPGHLGMIIGPTAKGIDQEAFKTAQRLADNFKVRNDTGIGSPLISNEQNKQILDKTGWFTDPEGRPRTEIGDDDAKLTTDKSGSPGFITALKNVLSYPSLYKAYPELAKTKLIFENPLVMGDAQGYYSPAGKVIGIPAHSEISKETLLHEVQHAIQDKEGWQSGGAPQEPAIDPDTGEPNLAHKLYVENLRASGLLTDEHENETEAFYEYENKYGVEQAAQVFGGLANAAKEDSYERLYGEAEARNTAFRSQLPDEFKKQVSPLDTITASRDISEGVGNSRPDDFLFDYPEEYATGGEVGGRGGVDQNLAWLTRGEFVQRKDAVEHYGVDFMRSINNMELPKFDIGGLVSSFSRLSSMGIPAFESGGLFGGLASGIASSLPSFAGANFFGAGGPSVGSVYGAATRAFNGYTSPARTFNLNIGGQEFNGLWGSLDTVSGLEAFAGYLEASSAGRPPSFFR